MDFVFELEGGEIRGVAAVIINAVNNDNLDIDYVFSKQFEKDLRKNHYKLHSQLLEDWEHSLVYYDSVKEHIEESVGEEDGEDIFDRLDTIRDNLGYEFGFFMYNGECYTGMDIAAYVVFHLRTHLFSDPANYLDEMLRAKYITQPNILAYKDHLQTGAGFFTLYDPSKTEEQSISINSARWMYIPTHTEVCRYGSMGEGSDLVHFGEHMHEWTIRGFIPALLGVVFEDENRRTLLSYDLTDYNYVTVWDECFTKYKVNVTRLPTKLGVPAKRIIDNYYPKALEVMSALLAQDDIAFDETQEYTIRKMLEMELKQAANILDHSLWKMLPPDFQKTILAYHALFIKYLQKNLGIEVTEIPMVEESEHKADYPGTGKPDSSFFAVTEKMTYESCEKQLIQDINDARSKADACRKIMSSDAAGYFFLKGKGDQEKAEAVNPWVAFTNKKYVFKGDDFRKARNG